MAMETHFSLDEFLVCTPQGPPQTYSVLGVSCSIEEPTHTMKHLLLFDSNSTAYSKSSPHTHWQSQSFSLLPFLPEPKLSQLCSPYLNWKHML